jgi:hypothetical protein
LLKTGLVDVFAYYYVFLPKYSAYSIVPQNDIDRLVNDFFNNTEYLKNPIIFERTERLKTLKYSATDEDNSHALRWIDYINSLRGFNIYDYNPELANWATKVKQNAR